MAKAKISTTNASRKGGNNKTGKGGFGDRPESRNNNGQRSAPVVAFSRNIRELIVTVGEEKTEHGDKQISRIEAVIRMVYQRAQAGDEEARNFIVERVEGKVNQTFELLLSMIDYSSLDESQLSRIAAGENPIAVVFGIATK